MDHHVDGVRGITNLGVILVWRVVKMVVIGFSVEKACIVICHYDGLITPHNVYEDGTKVQCASIQTLETSPPHPGRIPAAQSIMSHRPSTTHYCDSFQQTLGSI
jgi:hypothetical protein